MMAVFSVVCYLYLYYSNFRLLNQIQSIIGVNPHLVETQSTIAKNEITSLKHVHSKLSLFVRPEPEKWPTNLLLVKHEGRLGNAMGEFASLWGLARQNKRYPIVTNGMKELFLKYFKHITILSTSELLANGTTFNRLSFKLTYSYKYREKPEKYQYNIKLAWFPNFVTSFHPYWSEIKDEFQFRDDIMAIVNERLSNISHCSLGNCTYIGVHVRRTDYSTHLKNLADAEIVGTYYLYKAMMLMKQKYPDAVFVVASDDMDWCKANLNSPVFRSEYVGNNDTGNPAVDLATLSACNHSIITHGTFGFWGAYLSGGEVILPTAYAKHDVDPYIVREVTGAHIQGWTALNGVPLSTGTCPKYLLLTRREGWLGGALGEYITLFGYSPHIQYPLIAGDMEEIFSKYYQDHVKITSFDTKCLLDHKYLSVIFRTKNIKNFKYVSPILYFSNIISSFHQYVSKENKKLHFEGDIISEISRFFSNVTQKTFKNCDNIGIQISTENFSQLKHFMDDLFKDDVETHFYIHKLAVFMKCAFPHKEFLIFGDRVTLC